jgi:hypothetical protein
MQYYKFSAYYVKTDDNNGGTMVRFYEKDGGEIKHTYYSWDKKQLIDDFEQFLIYKLDPYHKYKVRPSVIKIYETDIGETIGFYDKNDNLIYFNKYNGSDKLDDILNAFKDDVSFIIDLEYLKETQNIIIYNEYNTIYQTYSKVINNYWNYLFSKN